MSYTAVVEMPKKSIFKYEIDKHHGVLVVDRQLPITVPQNYGFIKNTLAEDGDALDVYIVSDYAIEPLAEVQIEVVAALICEDRGIRDDKVIAVVKGSNTKVDDLRDIIYYLKNYKEGFVFKKLVNHIEADKLIQDRLI